MPNDITQQPQGSPSEQALGAKLLAEINAGLNLSTQLITMQMLLTSAQTRITQLETELAAARPVPPAA